MPTEKIPLWVIEDGAALRLVLGELLNLPEYELRFFDAAEPALKAAAEGPGPRLILSDLSLPGASGLDLLEKLSAQGGEFEFILMTAFASAESALKALRLGAFDYVIKPFKNDELLNLVHNAADKLRLTQENLRLRRALSDVAPGIELIGQAPSFKKVLDLIDALGNATSSVLIAGESGTGKELIARALHRRALPAGAPFVGVNCGAMPEGLLESELFGYQKGAFTGATENRRGLIESAHGGTLFLDEIGEMTAAMQVKLLRVLQEKKVRPVGASEERAVEFRLICATHRDLKAMARAGAFREDLFYRIMVISIETPPLRERAGDIALLAHHFLKKFAPLSPRPVHGFSAAALRQLTTYAWPGNVRELENVIERAVVLSRSPEIGALELGLDNPEPENIVVLAARPANDAWSLPAEGVDLELLLDRLQSGLLSQALAATAGNQTEAAIRLKITPRTLRYMMKKYGLKQD